MKDGTPLEDRIAQLREENEQLRRAARSFGELAERLMRQLETERRRTARMRLNEKRPQIRQRQLPVG